MINTLLITSMDTLDKAVKKVRDIRLLDVAYGQEQGLEKIKEYSNVDVVLVTAKLDGGLSISTYLKELRRINQDCRIAFLGAEIPPEDYGRKAEIEELRTKFAIEPTLTHRLNLSILEDVFYRPKDVFLENRVETKQDTVVDLGAQFDTSRSNVYMISSIKGGVGKTFVSSNVAAAIAKFGKKKDGRPPQVVILDGDLQTLSVGTVLGLENERYNLRTALSHIADIIDDDGNISGDENEIEKVNAFIKKCLLPYKDIPNFFGLVGSQLNFTDLVSVNAYHYYYLIDVVSDWFDVVIIDSNSSLEHVTTGPMLQLAKECYYVTDLDFNSIRANLRYRQELKKLDVLHKVKYVLNKSISPVLQSYFVEKLDYDERNLSADGFAVCGKIPIIDPVVTLNRMFAKTPVVLDETFVTLPARLEFAQLANQIYKMDNFLDLKLESESYLKGKKKKR